jgi:hypothetical protein
VPSCLEPLAQLPVVVELAIEDGDDRAIFVENGLLPRAEVDDTQSSVHHAEALVHEHTFVVRTSMAQGVPEPAEGSLLRQLSVQVVDPCNATHYLVARSW